MGKILLSMFFLSVFLLSRYSFSYAQMSVFVFGDSQVDVGNNNYLPKSVAKANFPHNGIDFPNKIPTGRFSNGKNTADFICEKLGVPTSPPYLGMKENDSYEAGVSFASAGSGILNSNDIIDGQAIPLTEQVTKFVEVQGKITKKLGTPEGLKLLSKSVFVILAGSNDLIDYFNSTNDRQQNSQQKLFDNLLSTLKGQIKRLHHFGARRFLVPGFSMIGCVPKMRVQLETEECDKNINDWAVKYNEELVSLLKGLKMELTSMSYSYFNGYNLMSQINQNPSSYGFIDIKSGCCGTGKLRAMTPCLPTAQYCDNRRGHVYWDFFHPTEATANIFAQAMYDASSKLTFPVSLRELVAAP